MKIGPTGPCGMIGVLADDLTGAAELAGIAVRRGIEAVLVRDTSRRCATGVVCVDTDTRSRAPVDAAACAAAAVQVLRSAGARQWYKKVDSVLRGPVLAEVEAVRRALGATRVLLLPANPSRQRVIREGHYFIAGTPLHESEFARDPEHPRWSSEVRELLGMFGGVTVALAKHSDPLPAAQVVVGEAATLADLKGWAARWEPDMLAAGGADFFEALLERWGPEVREGGRAPNQTGTGQGSGLPCPEPSAGLAPRRLLWVSGTASPAATTWIHRLAEDAIAVVRLLEFPSGGAGAGGADTDSVIEQCLAGLERRGGAVLCLGSSGGAVSLPEGSLWVRRLAEVAGEVVQRARPDLVLVDGGATAARLLERLGWSCLRVTREWAPGVVELVGGPEGNPPVVVKPGSYPWPEEIARLWSMCGRG